MTLDPLFRDHRVAAAAMTIAIVGAGLLMWSVVAPAANRAVPDAPVAEPIPEYWQYSGDGDLNPVAGIRHINSHIPWDPIWYPDDWELHDAISLHTPIIPEEARETEADGARGPVDAAEDDDPRIDEDAVDNGDDEDETARRERELAYLRAHAPTRAVPFGGETAPATWRWLGDHQNENGSLSPASFDQTGASNGRAGNYRGRDGGDGRGSEDLSDAATALLVLAMAEAGHTYRDEKYGQTAKRALRNILNRAKGLSGDQPEGASTNVYARDGLLTQALQVMAFARTHTATNSAIVRVRGQPLLDCLVASQLIRGDGTWGGWARSQADVRTADLATTAFALLVLQEVDPEPEPEPRPDPAPAPEAESPYPTQGFSTSIGLGEAAPRRMEVANRDMRVAGALQVMRESRGVIADAMLLLAEPSAPDASARAGRLMAVLRGYADTPIDPLELWFATLAVAETGVEGWRETVQPVRELLTSRIHMDDHARDFHGVSSLPLVGSADPDPLLSLDAGRPGTTALYQWIITLGWRAEHTDEPLAVWPR